MRRLSLLPYCGKKLSFWQRWQIRIIYQLMKIPAAVEDHEDMKIIRDKELTYFIGPFPILLYQFLTFYFK
jgi:hypothetical protein